MERDEAELSLAAVKQIVEAPEWAAQAKASADASTGVVG